MGVLSFVGNDYRELSVYVSIGLENYIGGKYGRSEEAAFGFFVQLCLEFLCNEDCRRCHGDKCHRVGGKWDLLSVSNAYCQHRKRY